MVGMGETEKEMALAIQKVRDMGGRTHLFSFFPEPDSAYESFTNLDYASTKSVICNKSSVPNNFLSSPSILGSLI